MIALLFAGALAAASADGARADCPPLEAGPNPFKGVAAFGTRGPSKQVAPPRGHAPVPRGDLSSVRIALSRSGCLGSCPMYSVELRGDGTATYYGLGYVLIAGKHDFEAPPAVVQCLLEDFRSVDFWSLKKAYAMAAFDLPQHVVTLEIGGRKKTLTDYAGVSVGMPPAILALEAAIDRAGADRWVRGDSRTIDDLRREKFDFHSIAAADLVATAAADAPEDVVLALLAEGAPATGHFSSRGVLIRPDPALEPPSEPGAPAIEVASQAGRPKLVRALIAAGALSKASAGEKAAALRAAARSGSVETVAEILSAQPDVNGVDEEGRTALMSVRDSDYSSLPKEKIDAVGVTRLLLAKGANPHLIAANGETALHWVDDGEVVRLLLAAGAGLEVRDKDGRTPLLAANTDEASKALIDAGADISAVAQDGTTVLEGATRFRYVRTLTALKARGVQ